MTINVFLVVIIVIICFMFSDNYRKALKRLMKSSLVQALSRKNVLLTEYVKI